MSLLESQVVDTIGIDKNTGEVVLSIIDGEDWKDENFHMALIQEKINFYLSFIESEEIYEVYKEAIGKNMRIDLILQYEPNINATKFLKQVEVFLNKHKYKFEYRLNLD